MHGREALAAIPIDDQEMKELLHEETSPSAAPTEGEELQRRSVVETDRHTGRGLSGLGDEVVELSDFPAQHEHVGLAEDDEFRG
jgi:hypothetical protein